MTAHASGCIILLQHKREKKCVQPGIIYITFPDLKQRELFYNTICNFLKAQKL